MYRQRGGGDLVEEQGPAIGDLEAGRAQRFLSSGLVNIEEHDALGIAEMMRMSHQRPVHIKSPAAQTMRSTFMQLVSSQLQIESSVPKRRKFSALLVPALRPVSIMGHPAPLLRTGKGAELPAPKWEKVQPKRRFACVGGRAGHSGEWLRRQVAPTRR